MELPRIISVDDHVLEPPDVWTSRLPARLRDRGPRVVRERGVAQLVENGIGWLPDPDAPDASWADVWCYDDLVFPLVRGYAMAGHEDDDALRAITYDEVLPGAYQREARLADMRRNHTDVSLCFPSITRFCGQIFLERDDKDLALLGVQAFNDWMIEDWAGPVRPAQLIPLTLIPLWEVELAAAEVRRCAAKGSHAIAFSECPPFLGLPSIYSGYWDPLFAACVETETVVNVHVGSSSRPVRTATDAPADLGLCLIYINSMLAFSDWLYAGMFELFPQLKVALSESQAGWIPFAAERIDNTWRKGTEKFATSIGGSRRAKQLPSSAIEGHIYACVFDDLEGLRNREAIGMGQLLFETDFPHADSTFPHSARVATDLVTDAGLSAEEIYRFIRGNAIDLYGLDRHFGIMR